jgi:hypothetical protein
MNKQLIDKLYEINKIGRIVYLIKKNTYNWSIDDFAYIYELCYNINNRKSHVDIKILYFLYKYFGKKDEFLYEYSGKKITTGNLSMLRHSMFIKDVKYKYYAYPKYGYAHHVYNLLNRCQINLETIKFISSDAFYNKFNYNPWEDFSISIQCIYHNRNFSSVSKEELMVIKDKVMVMEYMTSDDFFCKFPKSNSIQFYKNLIVKVLNEKDKDFMEWLLPFIINYDVKHYLNEHIEKLIERKIDVNISS